MSFTDGTLLSFTLATGDSQQHAFWGVSGTSSDISAVSIVLVDSGGGAWFDRFATGASVGTVPEPATPALAGIALVAAGAVSRRRKA